MSRSTQMTAEAVSATPITAAPQPMRSAARAFPNCCRSVATVASTIDSPLLPGQTAARAQTAALPTRLMHQRLDALVRENRQRHPNEHHPPRHDVTFYAGDRRRGRGVHWEHLCHGFPSHQQQSHHEQPHLLEHLPSPPLTPLSRATTSRSHRPQSLPGNTPPPNTPRHPWPLDPSCLPHVWRQKRIRSPCFVHLRHRTRHVRIVWRPVELNRCRMLHVLSRTPAVLDTRTRQDPHPAHHA